MALLVIQRREGAAVSVKLVNDETVIGREPGCTIRLGSDLVRRRHARIVQRGDEFFLEDIGSRCGTFLNGRHVKGTIALQHNDEIMLGQVYMRFDAPASGNDAIEPLST